MSTVFLAPIRIPCGSLRLRALDYDELVCLSLFEELLPVAAEDAGLPVWEIDDVLDAARKVAITSGGVSLVPLRALERAASKMLGARLRIETRLTSFNGIAA